MNVHLDTEVSRLVSNFNVLNLDLNPLDSGRRCLPVKGFNECERDEDNECSEHSRCIDLEHLYRCECNAGKKV